MPRHSGRRGKIRAQLGELTTILNEQLDGSADNKVFTADNPLWARNVPGYPCVKPDGLLSGGRISAPETGNDSVMVAAGSVQIGGATIDFNADDATTVTRPVVAGNVIISAIVVDSAGAITAVAGTTGTPGGARGAAGGFPYIPVDKVLLGYVTLGITAAVVLESEIDNQSAERAAVPSFSINYLDGTATFANALQEIHTGDTTKKVYATYKFLTLQDVGDLFDWSLDITTAQIEAGAFLDEWVENVPGTKSWSGSFNGYFVNSFWFDQAIESDAYWYIELYDDSQTDNCWAGHVGIDWSISVARDAAVTEAMTFTGNGALRRTGSPGTCA